MVLGVGCGESAQDQPAHDAGFDAADAPPPDACGDCVISGQSYCAGAANPDEPAFACMPKVDPSGWTRVWPKRLGGDGGDQGTSVAIDGNGNVTLAGSFRNVVDFGGGPVSAVGDTDGFIASYDANAAFRWVRCFGGTDAVINYNSASAVTTDKSGNVYSIGVCNGAVDFGGGPVPGPGACLVSYDSAGALRWVRRFGGAPGNGTGVAVDVSGNVYATGQFSGTTDFGGGPVTSAGIDAFVASYTSAGAFRWVGDTHATPGSSAAGMSIAVDASANVFVVGRFGGTVDLGGTPSVTASDPADIFVASYTSTGTPRWGKGFASSGYDEGLGVAVDASGNVHLTGRFEGTVDFGGGPMTSSGMEVFVASFDSMGAFRWAKEFGAGFGAAVDGKSNVYVTGAFEGSLSFGGETLDSAGEQDIFVASFDSDGAFRWAKRYGSSTSEQGLGLAAGAGSLYVTGFFRDTVAFGGAPLVSAGGSDIFLVKLPP